MSIHVQELLQISHSGGDVDSGWGYRGGLGAGGIWDISELSTQYHYKPKIVL